MLKEIQTELIDTISTIATARQYFGELKDPEKAKLLAKELPIVLVDYVGDANRGALARVATFQLYIVHIQHSRHPDARTEAGYTVMDLIERIDGAITNASMQACRKPVALKRTVKLYDDISSQGYLTFFTRTLEVEIA